MAAYQYIYTLKDLSKKYPGGKEVIKNLYLSFLPGAKIGVVGPNGSGKSTLLKIMAGVETEFQGEAMLAEGAKVGYLPQEPQLVPGLTVQENVLLAFKDIQDKINRFNEIGVLMAEAPDNMDELLEEMTKLQDEIDAAEGWDLDNKAEVAMEALRCPPGESEVENLSGGEKRRVALCRLLLEAPDMVLLDEPTNHLDAESVAWLQRFLADFKGTVVMITHDRYFLDNVTGWILEMDRGTGYPYEGNYSAYLEKKAKRLEQENREEASRQRTLARELEWVRQGVKARQAKSKARIQAYDKLVAESENAQKIKNASITIPTPPRLGGVVIEVENMSKGYGDRLLIDNLSFKLPPGGIVGVIGPNGAGKSTLFRMITGQEQPDSGTMRVGETVQLSYVDQSRDALDGKKTVWEEISGGNDIIKLGGKTEVPSRAYVAGFNFRGTDQQKKVGQLSGGERNRVHLAKMLQDAGNLLLLDEPTNDLDTETLAALEEALESYAGCAVIISHDRWFLDRLATHILAFEGDSHVEWFEGNFEAYEEDLKRRKGKDASQPHRIKYKPLKRAA